MMPTTIGHFLRFGFGAAHAVEGAGVVGGADGCAADSGGYHFPSDASHHPGSDGCVSSGPRATANTSWRDETGNIALCRRTSDHGVEAALGRCRSTARS